MKKIISAAVAAALSVTCAAAAGAARISSINEALQKDEIHIIYNDVVVGYEDVKPINVNDRVLIPFRAALETMGASVDYDDATRTVTAAKGDTTITFELETDIIYVDKNGAKSEVKMDAPMVVSENRTMVPIRFMSEALGMQVGWDGETETVLIADYDAYTTDFSELMPNLSRTIELENAAKLGKSSISFNFTIDQNGTKTTADGDVNSMVANGAFAVEGSFAVNSENISVADANVDIIYDGNNMYFRTNIVNKLAEINPDLQLAALIINGEQWYSISAETIMPLQTKQLFDAALTGNLPDASAYKGYIDSAESPTLDNMIALAALADSYEMIDSHTTVTEKENGGYTVTIEFTPEEYAAYMGTGISTDTDSLSAKITADSDGTKSVTSAELEMKSADGVTMTFKLNGTSEPVADGETVAIPENVQDFTDIISLIAPAQ